MFAALKKLFQPGDFVTEAHAAYVTLVEQARKSWFYKEQAVPDTLDGRFDVIILHVFLLIHRLRRESSTEAAQFIRALSEVFFSDMDRSLREMGSGDTGVGKRIKKMAQAFYGRLHSYEQNSNKQDGFKECLKRNLYREGDAATDERLSALWEYVTRNNAHLNQQESAGILAGRVNFLD